MSQNQPPQGPPGGYPGGQAYPQQGPGQGQAYPPQGQPAYPPQQQQGQQQAYPQQGQQQPYPQQGQQQPYPQQGQQQQAYPQQGQQQQAYPQQGQQQAYPPQGQAPAKKKGGGLVLGLVFGLVVVAGLGGFFYYSHFMKWGYTEAPSSVREKVDPIIADMDAAADEVAKACADKSFKKNPLKGSKILDAKGLVALRAQCKDHQAMPFPPLDKVGEDFEITISKTDGFKCLPPNFLGTDDPDKTDCVMWRGSRAHFYVERASGSERSQISVELE